MTSEYQMWMTFNGGTERLRFPVHPGRINVRQGMQMDSVSIQGLGEVVIKQDPEAMTVSFDGYFPVQPSQFTQYEPLPPPMDMVSRITSWMKGNRPVHFFITGTPINGYFEIEQFPYREEGGDVGTIYYTLSLKEYKSTSARQVNVVNGVATLPETIDSRIDSRVTPKSHVVVAGESLYVIARRILGAGSRFPEIFELNRDIISNPHLIMPGMVLRLPA